MKAEARKPGNRLGAYLHKFSMAQRSICGRCTILFCLPVRSSSTLPSVFTKAISMPMVNFRCRQVARHAIRGSKLVLIPKANSLLFRDNQALQRRSYE
jgi:hypothetical protein